MTAAQYLKQLDAPIGVSGHEKEIANTVKSIFGQFCDEVKTDTLGNVIATKKGKNPSYPSLMIEAHMDELGLMVSRITDEGSLKFITVGGFDPKVLPGTEVTVWGKEKLFGVIGAKPPHLITEKGKVPSISELCVDIGFSKEKTQELVCVGDIITINTSYTELGESMCAARCIDDRGGLAIISRALEILSSSEVENDVVAVATVQEEVGLRGAKTAASHIQPDYAIAIDVCHATSPGVSEEAYPCKKGPVISIGPNLHTKLTRMLIRIAKEKNIDFQLEVCEGGTGTDAWEIQVAGKGVPTALISIPVRYMHANYEVCDTSDLENAARLIAEFAKELKGGEELCW